MKFFRTENCAGCDTIQEVLEDMCIAHEVIIVDEKEKSSKSLPNAIDPPVLADNGKIVQGAENIIDYLDELEEFKELWYKFQSDACYCDENELNQ